MDRLAAYHMALGFRKSTRVMKYEYSLVYGVGGISELPTDVVELVASDALRAVLTTEIEPYCEQIDRSAALATMLLRALTGGGPTGSYEERLEAETTIVQEERRSKHRKGVFLAVRVEGVVPDFEARNERETDTLIVRLNGAPKPEIRSAAAPAIEALITALSVVSERELAIEKVGEAIVFFREDGKPVYSFTPQGSANLTVATRFAQGMEESVEQNFHALLSQPTLGRVNKLLVNSLQTKGDTLRSFLSAWAGLEIFVAKVFSTYEIALFDKLSAHYSTAAYEAYLGRIAEVMKDKYRLVDKFALIAVQLAPEDADSDVAMFKAAKTDRDAIAHGQDIVESQLPVTAVQGLLQKYLTLHVQPAASF